MKLKPNNPKQSNRTKKIAATVAALGAAIGVNMGDVLAATSDMQNAELRKSSISSQKINKPDVRTPKFERTLKQRPSAIADKSSRPGLGKSPECSSEQSFSDASNTA